MCVHIIHTHTPLSNFAPCIYENTLLKVCSKKTEYSYFKIYLSLVDLLFCVNFVLYSKLIQLYTYIFFLILFHDALLQDIEYSSLYCTVEQCCLFSI